MGEATAVTIEPSQYNQYTVIVVKFRCLPSTASQHIATTLI